MNVLSLNAKDIAIWDRLVASYEAFVVSSQEFLAPEVEHVTLLRSALRNQDRITAIYILNYLTVPERKELFKDLLYQVSSLYGALRSARKVIQSLPREWVIANIKIVTEPLFRSGTSDEYQTFLDTCIDLDHELIQELVMRSASQDNSDIKEAGADSLQVPEQTNEEVKKISSNSRDEAIWKRLVASDKAFSAAAREFLAPGVDRVELMRAALRQGSRVTAVYMLDYLTIIEKKRLFGELVFLASFSQSAMAAVRKQILSLPRDWVMAHIRDVAEPLLQSGTYFEYRCLLGLYVELDRDLAYELAKRAASQSDLDIQEAGQDFLEILDQTAG